MRPLFRAVPVPLLVLLLTIIAPPAAIGGLFIWRAVGDVPFVNVEFFPDDEGPPPAPPAVADFGAPSFPLLDPLPSPHSSSEPDRRGKDLPAGFRVELWAKDLNLPTAIDFSPDGTLFVAEQFTGEIRLVRGGVILEQPRIKIAATEELQGAEPERAGERGLVGMALHPNFVANGLIYAYATLGSSPQGGVNSNALFRVRMDGDTVLDIAKVLEFTEASPTNSHNGGAMSFGPDGALYLAIGDGAVQPDADNPAQDPNDPRGKILRITLDQQGDVTGWEVHAMGFRNVFGLAFNPLTKELLAADNGPVGQDELNIVRQGANYGWPIVLGQAGDPSFKDPVIVWDPSITPTGITFYQGGRLPFLTNDLLLCQFNPNWILHWVRFDMPGQVLGAPIFDKEIAPCVTAVTVGPDGLVYTATHTAGLIYRIAPEP